MYQAIFFTDITDNVNVSLPLGAYKLAHSLRKQGYSCLVVTNMSSFSAEELKELLDLAVGQDTLLIGFSNTFFRDVNVERLPDGRIPTYPELKHGAVFPQGRAVETEIFDHLKTRFPWVRTVLGGAKAYEDFNNRNINFVCLGYGEKSIVDLVRHLESGQDLPNSRKNIWGATVIDNRFSNDYDFQTDDMVWTAEDIVNFRTLPLEVARGCIFKCKFCSYPMNGKQNLDFVKCEHNLKTELENNYRNFGIKDYLIIDDTFNDHVTKLERLRSVIKSLDFQPYFWGYHRLDLICTRPETMEILYDIGVRAMFFGIETMDPVSGRIIGKGFDRARQVQMVQHLRNTYPDLSLHGSFIVGLPQESEASVLQTFDQLRSQELPLHSWQVNSLKIYKQSMRTYNSDIEKNYQNYGYVDQGSDPDEVILNWKNDVMTYQRAEELARGFMTESYQSDQLHMTGQFAMGIASMGDPEFSFDRVRHTLFRDLDWYKLENQALPNFLADYKRQLFAILKNPYKSTT